MLEKKIKPRKAQLRGTLRAHAKKLETSRYGRGPARSLDGVTRRPCLSLAQPLGAVEAPSWDVGAGTEVTASCPHGRAGPPTEPHSSDFNSWPVGLAGTRPQNLQLRQGQPRTSSVPSALKRASHTGRCTRRGEGGRHKTEGPQADHEPQAGLGQGGAGPSPETPFILSWGYRLPAEGCRWETRVPQHSANKATIQQHTLHTALLHTSDPTAGTRNKPGTQTATISEDPEWGKRLR